MKRKPGRPRKAEQSFAESVPVKRKPGRPRKNMTVSVETVPQRGLSDYIVEWSTPTASNESDWISAHSFEIAKNGDLLFTRDGELIAAFRQWYSVSKFEAPPALPEDKAAKAEVTLSNAEEQLAGSLIASQYGFNQAQGNPYSVDSQNGTLNQVLHQANGVMDLEVSSAVEASTDLAGGINGPSPE
jgi:hypothetical protein